MPGTWKFNCNDPLKGWCISPSPITSRCCGWLQKKSQVNPAILLNGDCLFEALLTSEVRHDHTYDDVIRPMPTFGAWILNSFLPVNSHRISEQCFALNSGFGPQNPPLVWGNIIYDHTIPGVQTILHDFQRIPPSQLFGRSASSASFKAIRCTDLPCFPSYIIIKKLHSWV